MRSIKHIVIHATATREGQHFGAKDIDAWHKKRGWSGIGYHYVVLIDGSVEKGRPDWKIGAHVKGYNRHSIGVCYVGGLDKKFSPKDTRNCEQKHALRNLLKSLQKKYPTAKIVGHRDFSPDINGNGIIEPFEYIKACPCFDVKTEYRRL